MMSLLFAASVMADNPSRVAPIRLDCPAARPDWVGGRPAHGLHALGEEPSAAYVLGIVRRVDGCNAPAIVRTGIGNRGNR